MFRKDLGMIIAAGGSGSRFSKSVNKLLVDYKGKPLLMHSLANFLPVLAPGNMVIAAAENELENMQKLVDGYFPGNSIKWVIGGATRLASVANAAAAMPADIRLLAIHDAARPLAAPELLAELCAAAEEYGGAIPGCTPVDTIKVVDDCGVITQNLIRSQLAAVATPQVFDYKLYIAALKELDDDLLNGRVESALITDDAALFTQAGNRVKVVYSNEPNIKITNFQDISR